MNRQLAEARFENVRKDGKLSEVDRYKHVATITDVAEEHRKEIEILRADVRLKDRTLEEQKEQYGKQLEETRNENERLIPRTMEETLQQQKEQYETQLQQAREETVTTNVDTTENVSLV